MYSYRGGFDWVMLALRLVLGGAMIYGHGWSKVLRVIKGNTATFRDPIGLGPELSLYMATFAEGLCSTLLILGLFTRLATLPLMFTMLVAIVFIHWQDPFPKIELPLLYLAGFLVILVLGPGRYALDTWRKSMV